MKSVYIVLQKLIIILIEKVINTKKNGPVVNSINGDDIWLLQEKARRNFWG